MSDMKCPICNKQMKIGMLDQDDSMGTVWLSIMPCDCVCSYGASKAVWRELIRTRKALDVAVDALKRLEKELYFNNAKQTGHIADSVMSIPSIALEQITALEQKD